mmetsp:Transcript_20788/g.51205  ORF Transcript_20788/g.51205 Transcript_20788/m.51205 type:complete len:302 (+) Transcript_20788:384-1289(+)
MLGVYTAVLGFAFDLLQLRVDCSRPQRQLEVKEILDKIFAVVGSFVDTIVGVTRMFQALIFFMYYAVVGGEFDESIPASLWLATFLKFAKSLSNYLSTLLDNLRSILSITSDVSSAAFAVIALGLLVIALGPVFLFLLAQPKMVHPISVTLLMLIALPVFLSLCLAGAVVIAAVGLADTCYLLGDTYNAFFFGGNTSATEEGWACPIDLPGSEFLESIRFFQLFSNVYEEECVNESALGESTTRIALEETIVHEWIPIGNAVPESYRGVTVSSPRIENDPRNLNSAVGRRYLTKEYRQNLS